LSRRALRNGGVELGGFGPNRYGAWLVALLECATVGLTTCVLSVGPFARCCLSRQPHLAGHHPGSFRFGPESIIGSAMLFGRGFAVGKKLYVGNLSYNVTNQSLEELFTTFGSVRSAQVIQDRDTGRSKGFGFVEMDDDNAAREAIKGLHEKEHDGRPLTVNEAKPREERGGYSGNRGGGGGGGGGGRGGYGGRR
jgi:hypothetical protein